MKKRGLRLNTVLLLSIIGTVAAVLLCAVLLFLKTYQQSLIRSAQTSGRRSIAQVSSTVESYLKEMEGAMALAEESLRETGEDREEFFRVFLEIRPEVVAASTYNEAGELVNCYGRGTPMEPGEGENLSFRRESLTDYRDGYVSAPHVVTFFKGWYPWAVTMISRLDGPGEERWAALDIRCGDISSYINGVGIGQRGYCFLMDAEGNIVYHPQQQLLYSELKQGRMSV